MSIRDTHRVGFPSRPQEDDSLFLSYRGDGRATSLRLWNSRHLWSMNSFAWLSVSRSLYYRKKLDNIFQRWYKPVERSRKRLQGALSLSNVDRESTFNRYKQSVYRLMRYPCPDHLTWLAQPFRILLFWLVSHTLSASFHRLSTSVAFRRICALPWALIP